VNPSLIFWCRAGLHSHFTLDVIERHAGCNWSFIEDVNGDAVLAAADTVASLAGVVALVVLVWDPAVLAVTLLCSIIRTMALVILRRCEHLHPLCLAMQGAHLRGHPFARLRKEPYRFVEPFHLLVAAFMLEFQRFHVLKG
jgi:hypothetical protein